MNQNQVQVPEKAAALLNEKVKHPAFFEKLARDWNIVPPNAVVACQLLETAAVLRARRAQEMQKAASVGNPFLAKTLDGLKAVMAQEGQYYGPSGDETLLKQAAFEKTQESDVAHAALEVAEYLTAIE